MKRIFTGVLITLVFMVLAGPTLCYAGTTYDKVKKDGVVRVGMMYNSIPAAYFNDKNEWVGFDVDIAEEVVKRIGASMGKQLKVERVKVNNILEDLHAHVKHDRHVRGQHDPQTRAR